jgi:hypothetical protein
MRIEARHPALAGFDETALLPGPEQRVPVRAVTPSAASVPLTVVPYYPAFPTRDGVCQNTENGSAAAMFRETAGACIAYFADDIDRTCWRSGNPDLALLMQNTVTWLRGTASAPVSLDGDGMVESFAWETEPGYALHILNYTNPNMTRGFIRKFYAIGPQKAQLEVASGRRIASVRALRSNRSLHFTQTGAIVRFEVPAIVDYEIVVLTWPEVRLWIDAPSSSTPSRLQARQLWIHYRSLALPRRRWLASRWAPSRSL